MGTTQALGKRSLNRKSKPHLINPTKKTIIKTCQDLKNTFETSNKQQHLSKESLLKTTQITTFKHIPGLKNKYQNKVKTLNRDQVKYSPLNRNLDLQFKTNFSNKLAQRLQLAAGENDDLKVPENLKLSHVVVKALKENIPWYIIEALLQECINKPKIHKSILLQITFHRKAYLLLSVRTINLSKFKTSLRTILKKFKCAYATVLQHFNYNCQVEALASYSTPAEFANFERQLSRDAVECQAQAVEIEDYETGAVQFKCHPLYLVSLVDALQKRHYKVLFADYGFQPLERVCLQGQDRLDYEKFLQELQKFKEIDKYWDNVLQRERERALEKEENRLAE